MKIFTIFSRMNGKIFDIKVSLKQCEGYEMKELIIGGLYRHYKNKDYRVLGIAWHTETLEELVVYQALYDAGGVFGKNAIWVRPKSMFLEKLEYEGQLVARFRYVDNES